MIKGFTKQGFVAYKCTRDEIITHFGTNALCLCCSSAEDGFLVPILGTYLCLKCFSEFDRRSYLYSEDFDSDYIFSEENFYFEEEHISYYESLIPITGNVDVFEV